MSKNTEEQIDGFSIDLSSQFGRGSQSRCYRCYNPKYKIPLCVKIIYQKSDTSNMFYREIEIIQKLLQVDCQNLVKILHISKQENQCYIFMEYCQQGDLENFIIQKRNITKQLTIEEILSILEQLINGYKLIHDCRIIHRDLKPANILLGNNGYFQLADYGMAKILDDPVQLLIQSQVGTPRYMAPQVLIGDIYSNKCDVYSLGVVVYELVYQKLPIIAKTMPLLIEALNKTKYKKIQINDFPNNLGGSQQQQEKLFQFLSQSLVYEESQRISWEELFKLFPSQNSSISQPLSYQNSQKSLPNLQQNHVDSNILSDQDVRQSHQLEYNNTLQKETEAQISNGKLQNSIQSTIESPIQSFIYSSFKSNNQTTNLVQDQMKQDIPQNTNLHKDEVNVKKKVSKFLIKPIDNIIEKIIEFYLAKCSLAENLFTKNQKFLGFMDINKHLVNYRFYISRLQLMQIFLSGYQFSSLFNIYQLVFKGQLYEEKLQIIQELKSIDKQFLEQQITLLLISDTEELEIQKKYIKHQYILQKISYQKQIKLFSEYQQKYNTNFQQDEIICDSYFSEIQYSPKTFYNQYKNKFNEFNLNFKYENENINENESLINHKIQHLASSINFFQIEEKYNDLFQILGFDYKDIFGISDDQYKLKHVLQDYFTNLNIIQN